MSKFKITKTSIEDLIIIEPTLFCDSRGYFMETYNCKELSEKGFNKSFIQDNESKSRKGVLRGLHFQYKYPQGKLVRVICGSVFDVAVDLRANSPTYKQWFGIILSSQNKKMIYIPQGFAHGFLVLSEEVIFSYKCTNYYIPEYDRGIIWNDSQINIKWPQIDTNYILSKKDQNLPTFKKVEKELEF